MQRHVAPLPMVAGVRERNKRKQRERLFIGSRPRSREAYCPSRLATEWNAVTMRLLPAGDSRLRCSSMLHQNPQVLPDLIST
ncbi:MAG: hypothetical protein LBQ54_15785 [Planctomycetaceae bacterium]|nr:hypothetical protein [Planctomycetaceae bacterium]